MIMRIIFLNKGLTCGKKRRLEKLSSLPPLVHSTEGRRVKCKQERERVQQNKNMGWSTHERKKEVENDAWHFCRIELYICFCFNNSTTEIEKIIKRRVRVKEARVMLSIVHDDVDVYYIKNKYGAYIITQRGCLDVHAKKVEKQTLMQFCFIWVFLFVLQLIWSFVLTICTYPHTTNDTI